MNLEDIKAIVTGGTSGIGYSIAESFAKNGAQVVICGRSAEKVNDCCNKLGVKGIAADVSREEDVNTLFDFALSEMGDLNVLVNNAGFGKFGSILDSDLKSFTAQWEVNTKGTFLMGQAAARHFVEKKYGNIINIGSSAALNGFANGGSYVASKFAVSGLTQCWRAELRPHNVRVMQVNPSEVVSDFAKRAGFEQKEADNKLKPKEIAHLITSMLNMSDVGFIPDASVWATNPW